MADLLHELSPPPKDLEPPSPPAPEDDIGRQYLARREDESANAIIERAQAERAASEPQKKEEVSLTPPIGEINPDKNIATDLGKGATEIPRASYNALLKAGGELTENLWQLAEKPAEFMQSIVPLPRLPENFEGDVTDAYRRMLLDDPESQTGQMAQGVIQFLVGFIPAMKMTRGLASVKGGQILQPMVAGTLADVAVIDEQEGRLSDLIQQYPDFENPVTEFLQTDPNDTTAEAKLKQAIEGSVIGGVADGFVQSLRWFRNVRAARQEAALQEGEDAASQAAQDVRQAELTSEPSTPPEQLRAALGDENAPLFPITEETDAAAAQMAARTPREPLHVPLDDGQELVIEPSGGAPLTPRQAEIEQKFTQEVAADPEGMIQKYEQLPDTAGGRILNTDEARLLSEDYAASPEAKAELAPGVHEPASALVKVMYARRLAQEAKPDELPMVRFTMGGSGAGKTVAIKKIDAAESAAEGRATKPQIIYDTNMNNFASADQKVQQALTAGKDVQLMYVIRDPVDALVNGTLKRAKNPETGGGRVVSLFEHERTHTGSFETAKKMIAKYEGDPRVDIKIVDNRKGLGKAELTDAASLDEIDYTGLGQKLRQALDQEYENGNISESIYRHTLGESDAGRGLQAGEEGVSEAGQVAARGAEEPGVPGATERTGGAGGGGQLEPQRGGGAALEGVELPPSLAWLRDQSRYTLEKTETRKGRGVEFRLTPKKGEGFVEFDGREFRGKVDPDAKGWYDPRVAEIEIIKDEDFTRRYPRLKKDSGLSDTIPAKPQEGVLYRGMSAEEFEEFKRTGDLRSLGDMNLGQEQKGLTYYSTDPEAAAHYSHGFAPTRFSAVPGKPAYVVAIRDPGGHVKVPGTGDHERGISAVVGREQVVEVYEGVPYSAQPGTLEVVNDISGLRSGSATPPTVRLGWRKLDEIPQIGETVTQVASRAPRPQGIPEEIPDRIGNINLARIGGPEEVRQTIAEAARYFEGRLTHPVQSNEQTKLLANEIAADPKRLTETLTKEGGFTAAEVTAVRFMLHSSGKQLKEMAGKAAAVGASDLDKFVFRRQMAFHAALLGQASGAAREAGRALQAFKITALGPKEMDKAVREMVKMSDQGKIKTDQMAAMMNTLTEPQQIATFVRQSQKATTGDMLLEAWINGLLSGPQTHAVNTLSNTITAFWQLPERALAAQIRKLSGGEGVAVGEATAQAFGLVKGAAEGFRLAGKALRTGEPSDVFTKIEARRHNAISAEGFGLTEGGAIARAVDLLGETVRVPGRLLAAEDEFFKSVGYRMELNSRAWRQATQEGLEGDLKASRIQEIINNPPEDIKIAAIDAARYQTFTKPLGEAGQSFTQALNKAPALRVIMPFVRTPLNIMKFVGERTPLAPISRTVRQEIAAGGARRDMAIAKIGLGSMLMATFADMTASGLVSGNGPTDPRLRNAMRRTGWAPYSIKVGDQWVAYNRLDPIGATIGIAADLSYILGQTETAEGDEVAAAAVMAISQNIVSKTYMSGIADVMEIFASISPEAGASAGEKWLQRLSGTVVPAGVAQTTRVVDPNMRQVRSMIEQIRSRIPGLSDTLPPRLNLWGEPIMYTGGVGPDIASPLWASPIRKDHQVDDEMVRLEAGVSMPSRVMRGVEMGPEEYNTYVSLAGNELKDPGTGLGAHDTLKAIITGHHALSAEYKAATDGPDGGKALVIREVIQGFRQAARIAILDPDSPHYLQDFADKLGEQRRLEALHLGVGQ